AIVPGLILGGLYIGYIVFVALTKPNHCSLYLASIFFTQSGIANGQQALSHYASTHEMPVLMSNYTGTHWGLEAGGGSGFWDEGGNLIGELGANEEGLLVVRKKGGIWESYIPQFKII
ncbi:MAG: hypothetical protein AAFV07_14470, partial [Bacteroidota bacterium]